MLFEKINLEKLTRQELVILIQALSDFAYNCKTEKENNLAEGLCDRLSKEIQNKDFQIEQLKGEL
jgi:hypothetical protein